MTIKVKILLIIMLGLNVCDLKAQTYLLDNSISGTTISTCGGSFYDSGGPNSDYSFNENYNITFCSADGQQLDFDFETVDFFIQGPATCNNDRLRIYDGADATAPLLGTYCLDNSPGDIRSTGDCIHFTFSSNGGTNRAGWAASISCFSADEICGNGYDDNQDGSIDEFCSSCNIGSISFERWLNISGSSLNNLTGNSNFPNNPSESGSFNSFQGPAGYANSYGTRVQGYIVPQESGLYQFTVTSDDNSEFYLSTNGDPSNKVLLASVPGWTQIAQFDKYPEQESAEIYLIAGAHYYTEFLHKEGGGGDHLQVYWTTPSNSSRTIIAGSFLAPFDCCQMDAGSDSSICYGSSITLNTSPSGEGNLTYSWSPSTGLSSTTIQNPTASPISTTTYSVTVTDASGCTASDDIQITVLEEIVISASDENICLGETSNIIPSATGAGPFNYDWGTATTNNNALTVSPTVSTSYTLTVTDDNGCTDTETVQVIVDPLPTVSLSLANTIFCLNEPSFSLSGGNPTGGTFSGTGVDGSNFDISLAGVGTHTITYSFTDTNGCTNTASQDIIVYDIPNVSLNLGDASACEDETSISLWGESPGGGVYSGDHVSGTVFDVVAAGVGQHTINYTFTDGNGCSNVASQQIEVFALPTVSLSLTQTDVCLDDENFTLSGGFPEGGIYSGPGVGDGIFYPTGAGVGIHEITYTFTDSYGCVNSTSQNLIVHDVPNVTFLLSETNTCPENTTFALAGGLPVGGVYTGTGVTNENFDASAAGSGLHQISYTFTDANGCDNTADQYIFVYDPPIVSFDLIDSTACEDETSLVLSGGIPFGGTYSGDFVSGNTFDISSAGVGNHVVSYTYTDPNTCSVTVDDVIEIFSLPTVDLEFADPNLCVFSTTFLLNEGTPAGGTYSGPGVNDTNFDASAAGIGTHIITYSYTDDMGCVNQTNDELIVSNGTITSLTLPFEVVCEEETNIVLSGHNPTGGSFSGPGVTGNIFNANEAGVGNHTITYIYDDGICENIATDQIIVDPTPNVSFTLSDSEICFGSDMELTGGLPIGGSYSGPGVSGTTFNSLDAGAGSFEITYSFTSLDGCRGEATEIIVVHDFPSVDFDITDPITCVIEESFLMQGGLPSGGSYSGPGIVANYFNPSTAGVGDHEITYTFTDLNGCTNQATDIISVLDVPNPTLNLVDDEVCLNEQITLSGESPVGGTWEGPGVTGNVFNASEAGLGVHTINYYFEVSTCISSVSDVITVYDVPVVSLSSISQEICYGEIISLPIATPIGGYWTGNGIINDDFNSAFAGAGTHSLGYTYLDANGCSDTETIDITVFNETVVELDLPIEELCEDDANITLSGASPAGGIFSGPGVSGDTFDPTLAGPGIHIITYDFTDANGCVQTGVDQLEVIELPNATLNLSNFEACPGTGPQILSGGWPLGGSYSGTAVSGNQFDPELAGTGIHTITYTVTVNGCTSFATDEFEVFDVNTIELELTDVEVCIGEDITLNSNAPAGGNYSGVGVNPWTGTFSSVVAGLGTHTILYEYIDENGCNVELSDELIVFDVFPAALNLGVNLACATETYIPLTGGSPEGGTWSGPGVTGDSFNPWSLGAGTYTINYHYQDGNGCEATAIDEITVESAPNVTFTYEDDHCNLSTGSITFQFQNQIDVSFIEFSLNDGINWMTPIGDHIGVITYGNLSNGTYELVVRNISAACETVLGIIVIDDIAGPTADAGPDVTIPASTSTQLNGTGGSFYSWTPSIGLNNTNIQNPIASPTQTTTYTLEVTDIYGCVATDQLTVYVDVPCAGTLEEGDFPYVESFESGFGIWSQDGIDDFDWFRNNGTVSSSGPSSGSDGTWYVMAEGSGNANQTGIFRSPCFDLGQESCAQFTFDYFLANSGSLTLQASNDFGNNWLDIWTDSGNQGTSWNTQVMDLFGYLNSNLQLRFVADMGSESSGSMGIDNVEFITTGCGCSDTSSPFTLFNLVPDPQPFSVDIDCDGDADMLAGGDEQLFFFENNGDGTYTDQTGTAQDIMPGLSFLDMTIGLVDLDNDGDKDLSVVGNEAFNKFFFWNTGTKTNPIFTPAGTGGTPANPISNFNFSQLDGGYYIGYADPTIFWVDLDNDGDYDAVVGGKLGWFQYYENIGDESSPNFVLRTGTDNPFNGLRVDGADEGNGLIQYESSPFLIDWDGDGDFDMFSGNQISTVQFFENIGTATNPIFIERSGGANPFDGVIFSEDSHLSILDEDCDGDWDVFYGVGDTVDDAEITVCDLLVAVPNFAQASSDQSHYCLGDPIFLLELSAVGVSWSWSGPNGFSSTEQNPFIPNSTMDDAGTYTVTITNEQGCISTSTIEITISETIADAGPDATIDIGDITQNSGAGNGLTIYWTPAIGLSDPTVLNPVASPTATTTYTLTVIDQFGCVATDQMTIFVVGDECSYDEEIFHSDFETTTGDNFWAITNNANDGNFEIGVPSPYIQSGVTIMELNPQEGSQSLITGNATNYNQDLDGGPSIARSININLPTEANSINLSLYWYLSHFINGNSSDYLTIEIRDASNNSVLHTLVDENGAPTDRDAVWTFASVDLSAHAGKTIYIYISAADIGNGSKLEVGIDNVSILGTFSTVADLTLTDNDVCDLDSPITLSGGTPEGGVYAGPGVTGNIFDPSVAGPGVHTISYQYTNIEGCIAVAVEDIEVYESPLVELNLSVNEACINQSAVGLFGGNPTGGTWSGLGVSGSSFYPSEVGVGTHTISYTVTDLNGCQNSITDDFVVYAVPIVSNISYTDAYCGLDNGTMTIDFEDIENIGNIQFSLNGGFDWLSPIPDADGQVTYSDLPATTYDIWVQDENTNCPFQVQVLTIEEELGPMVDLGPDINKCRNEIETVNPIIENGQAPYTYVWTGPNGFVSDQLSNDLIDEGIYQLVVTDDNGCTGSDSVELSNFSLSVDAIISPIECFGETNGRIRAFANGTSPFRFTIVGQGSNGSGFFNGLAQGVYSLEVEDAYGCFVTQTFTVPGPPPLICSQDSCVRETTDQWLGAANGPFTASAGSTNISLEVINQSNTDMSNFDISTSLSSSIPRWFVENVEGLPSIELQAVWDTEPEAQLSDIDDLDDKGTITITLNFDEPVNDVVLHIDELGDFGFDGTNSWSNSSEWRIIDAGLSLKKLSGTADLQVMSDRFFRSPDVSHDMQDDAQYPNGEGSAAGSIAILAATPVSSISFEVTGIGVEGNGFDNVELAISKSVCYESFPTDYLCDNTPGTASISPLGGVHPFTYEWDNGETTQTATNLNPGIHTVTITDANDCLLECSVEIEDNSILIDAGPRFSFCEGDSGTLMPSIIVGTDPIQYQWSGPNGFDSTEENPTVTEGGIYTLDVIDGNNCTATDYVRVYAYACNETTNCNYLHEFNNFSYYGSDGTLDWYDFGWDEIGDNNSAISGDISISNSQLSMQHTDNTEPSIQRQIDLSGHSLGVLSFDFITQGGVDGNDQFQVEIFDGASWTVIFESSGSTSTTHTPWLDIADYLSADTEIRFTIVSGFSDPGEELLIDNVRIDLDCLCEGNAVAGIDQEICEGDSIQLIGMGVGVVNWEPVAFLSDPTILDPIAFPSETTTFTLTVTDDYGCVAKDEITIQINEAVEAEALPLFADYCLDGSGAATVNISQGEGPFTINWESLSSNENGTTIQDDIGSTNIENLNGNTIYCIQIVDSNGCTISFP